MIWVIKFKGAAAVHHPTHPPCITVILFYSLGNPKDSWLCSLSYLLSVHCQPTLNRKNAASELLQGKTMNISCSVHLTQVSASIVLCFLSLTFFFLCFLSLTFFSLQTVANLIERRLFESKESKWVSHCVFSFSVSLPDNLTSPLVQLVMNGLLVQQASAGEIPANRSHPGISAGQRGRARTANWGWRDDHSSWKAAAGVFTAPYQ